MNRSYYDVSNPLLPPPTGAVGMEASGRRSGAPEPRQYTMSGATRPYSQSQPRLPYEPARSATPSPRDTYRPMALQVPASRQRPRSVPPPMALEHGRRRRPISTSRSSSRSSSSSSRSRHASPLGKVRHVVRDTFTDSPSGLGVGILGAVVGGLVAHEASHKATARAQGQRLSRGEDGEGVQGAKDKDSQKSRALATLAGALVGGLGANAVEKRFHDVRERDREKEEAWQRKHGRGDCDADFVHGDRRRRRQSDDDDWRYRHY